MKSDMKPWHSGEDVGQYESLFPLLPDYVAHYTVGHHMYGPVIGLPDKYSLSLADDISAAVTARRMGLSISTIKRNYPYERNESRWLGFTDRIDSIYKFCRDRFGYYISLGLDVKSSEESYKELSMQFFYRNLATFDAAKRLAELGYLCEVAAILRVALEQVGLCSKLWHLDWKEEIVSLRPSESLNALKAQVPSTGQLYGLLSKYIHFEYDHHTHFLHAHRLRCLRCREIQF